LKASFELTTLRLPGWSFANGPEPVARGAADFADFFAGIAFVRA
jgi:hypothetical protein